METKGKVALVTGGGTRVGRALSLGLAQAGARVVIHYNNSMVEAQQTLAQAQQLGVEALAVQADLAQPENARMLAQQAIERFGRVDILVHAAAPFVRLPLREMTLATWRKVNAVLVESFWVLAQELSPGMTQRQEGHIVAILDTSAFAPAPAYLAHTVGKSALWSLVCNLAVELAPWVKVNGVAPGPVLPPPGFTQTERVAKTTLLGRWGSPQDVVEAVLFLIRSNYVTGEALFVDGGERWASRR